MLDRIGTESGGGGLNLALRDLARFGEMMRNNGRAADGQQVLPKAVVDDIRRGGDPAKFAEIRFCHAARLVIAAICGGSRTAPTAHLQRGIHGPGHLYRPQGPDGGGALWLTPSRPTAPMTISLPMYQVAADALMKK